MQPAEYRPTVDIDCLEQLLFLKPADLRWVWEDASQDSTRVAGPLPLTSVEAVSLQELQSLYLILFRWPLLARKFSRLALQISSLTEPYFHSRTPLN